MRDGYCLHWRSKRDPRIKFRILTCRRASRPFSLDEAQSFPDAASHTANFAGGKVYFRLDSRGRHDAASADPIFVVDYDG